MDAEGLLDRIDVDAVLARADVDALLARIDLNADVDCIDVGRIIEKVDVNALLQQVDVDALVEGTELSAVVARSTSASWARSSTPVAARASALTCSCTAGSIECCGGGPRARRAAHRCASMTPRGSRRDRQPPPRSRPAFAGPLPRGREPDRRLRRRCLHRGVPGRDGRCRVEYLLSVLGWNVELSDMPWLTASSFVTWSFLYFAYPLSVSGRTLGKAVLGLRVVRADGSDLGLSRAALRVLVYPLSFLVLGVGLLLILLRRDRRALHDVLAGTAVV